MFSRLLVPLDGSRLAEAALPAAACLAGTPGARVILFHVIERNAPQEIHGERHLTGVAEARAYLDGVAARAFPPGIPVDRHVHEGETGSVARSIAGHAGEFGADLVVMCTHGGGGLRGFVFGRIPQQVAAQGATPILLVPPAPPGGGKAFSCGRLLVALDGNPDHEAGLRVAAELAKTAGGEIRLVMVVRTVDTLSGEEAATAKMLPGATQAVLELAEQDARGYLERHQAALTAAGLSASAVVLRGEPSVVIPSAAERTGADLIVLATHGKTGMDAFWSGSATPNVASRSMVPLLLVPVPSTPDDRPA